MIASQNKVYKYMTPTNMGVRTHNIMKQYKYNKAVTDVDGT